MTQVLHGISDGSMVYSIWQWRSGGVLGECGLGYRDGGVLVSIVKLRPQRAAHQQQQHHQPPATSHHQPRPGQLEKSRLFFSCNQKVVVPVEDN